jgi:hypothetical protein
MKLWTALIGLAALGCAASAQQPSAARGQQPVVIPENWAYAMMSGGAMGWETTTMDRDILKDTAVVTRFVYYAKPQAQSGIAYSVVVQDVQFKCAAKQFRLGPGLFLSNDMKAVADSKPEDAWADVGDQTPESVMRSIACDGVAIGNQKTARSSEAAIADVMKAKGP